MKENLEVLEYFSCGGGGEKFSSVILFIAIALAFHHFIR